MKERQKWVREKIRKNERKRNQDGEKDERRGIRKCEEGRRGEREQYTEEE